jgi:hypothetical protein
MVVRRLPWIVPLALAALNFSTTPASAAPDIHYGIQDDAWLVYGPGTLPRRLDLVQSLGVTTVRFTIRWDQVAPTRPLRALAFDDPAYRWGTADAILKALHARGIDLIVTLIGTPAWANKGGNSNVAPSSSTSFAGFAYAAAKRYPFVRKWAIWNEPNLRLFLEASSPSLYVKRLLNPAYAAIHHANARAVVAGGVTAARGTRGGFGPLAWVRGMAAAHARLDAYAHNPYATRRIESPLKGACAYCDVISMANLNKLLKEVRRDFGNKPVWLTEYGYQTNPPDRLSGVSPTRQALYVSESALRAYQAPRVTELIQFLIRDEVDVDRFQTGLFTGHGVAKPSYSAFRFPFAQVTRRESTTTLWGQIRPGKGVRPYRLQIRTDGAWHWSGPVRRTTKRGFLSLTLTAPRGSRIRVWSPREAAFGWPLLVR